jgi:ribulose-phosphate 3-epimerase
MATQIRIAPSMVESDLGHLADAVREMEEAGVEVLHADVADGHFVPNIMVGPYLTAALCRAARVPVGVHLMITDPVRYAPTFAQGGADTIFFHVEAVDDLVGSIHAIRDLGAKVGVVLKPATPAESVAPAVGEADCLMAMTVEPGFSGQGFMESACEKIPRLREMFGEEIDIYVDGGINPETIGTAWRYGANVMVAGAAVFHADLSPGEAVRRLQQAALAAVDAGGL